ncbi:MAG TPA: division/cell wall cluster transcriptional repressor MraZ [Caldilineae bacterium]|jgi:MraZ protein|nr:division/cell wall cluster transcriptional repressor MraZ [Caldilineae bacterium]
MFLGHHIHNLDDKGRLTIPAKYREDLAEGMVVTRGNQRQIVLYPLREWQALCERIDALPKLDRRASNIRRLVYAYAEDLTMDRQGRIIIPSHLREFAHIENEVLIVGLNSYIELWAPDMWREVESALEDDSFEREYFETLNI